MFDSGASHSFIKKSALQFPCDVSVVDSTTSYLMADGVSILPVKGFVQLCVQFHSFITTISAGIVESLCADCVLGMDYIDKYRITLDNYREQIHLYVANDHIVIPMEKQRQSAHLARLTHSVCLHPFEEKAIPIVSSATNGTHLFQPDPTALSPHGLLMANAAISARHRCVSIPIYNSTSSPCYLPRDAIVGSIFPSTSIEHCSVVFDESTKQRFDEDQTDSVTPSTVLAINTLTNHLDNAEQSLCLKRTMRRHHALFDTTTASIADTSIPHIICTGDHPPPTARPYPQSDEKQRALFNILQEMLRNKQIRPSNSHFSAPVLLIKKRDGTYRFVVDYRKLNNITISDNYPLPNPEQSLQKVGGYRFYTKLDLRSGYFQIPIREHDRHKTAFITVHGLFEFNVLAQGLKNSPPSFQRVMSDLLSPCKEFCLVYLDDVLIYSSSFDQHVNHLNQVLALLNTHKFQLNPQKCEFVHSTINYLGHVVSGAGIQPLPERIDKILGIPQPTSLDQANAFIGALGWYKKFIKNFSHLAAPILSVTNLTRSNKHKFRWDTDQQDSFVRLKTAITSGPLFLSYPDPDAPLILATDASDNCIGGVLYQDIDNERKNIYFHSQMLPRAQRRWPTIEKEALAIYYCVFRMKSFLLGREFIVQTDHCPLRELHRKASNNRRVDRISLVLQQFNVTEIRHVSGKCNCMADYLSRCSHPGDDDDQIFDPDFGLVPGACSTFVPSPSLPPVCGALTTRAMARAQTAMPSSSPTPVNVLPAAGTHQLIDEQPSPERGHDFDVAEIKVAQTTDSFCQQKRAALSTTSDTSYVLNDDILYKIQRVGPHQLTLICVPLSLVPRLLKIYHDSPWSGHFGSRRTYFKLRDKYWWPQMKQTITDYIQHCSTCQRFNVDRRKPPGFLHPIDSPSGPFQLIGIDYLGPFPETSQGNKYVLTITDFFTKWVVAIPLPNQTAQTTVHALHQNYVCLYGVPEHILSDQGTHFVNHLMVGFRKLLGFHHIKSTPYRPQTNGAVERFNSTFERQLAKLTEKNIHDWDFYVQSVVFAYNTGRHASTKFSPFELLYGRSPRLPPDGPRDRYDFSVPHDYFHHLQRVLRLYHEQAKRHSLQSRLNYKRQFDRNRSNPQYFVGDAVLRRLSQSPSKLAQLYSHPCIVVQSNHPTYWIQDSTDNKVHQVHVSQLRSCRFDTST